MSSSDIASFRRRASSNSSVSPACLSLRDSSSSENASFRRHASSTSSSFRARLPSRAAHSCTPPALSASRRLQTRPSLVHPLGLGRALASSQSAASLSRRSGGRLAGPRRPGNSQQRRGARQRRTRRGGGLSTATNGRQRRTGGRQGVIDDCCRQIVIAGLARSARPLAVAEKRRFAEESL